MSRVSLAGRALLVVGLALMQADAGVARAQTEEDAPASHAPSVPATSPAEAPPAAPSSPRRARTEPERPADQANHAEPRPAEAHAAEAHAADPAPAPRRPRAERERPPAEAPEPIRTAPLDAGIPDEELLAAPDAGVPPPVTTTGPTTPATIPTPSRETIVVQVPSASPPPQQVVQVPVPMPVPSTDYSELWAMLDELMPGLPITEHTGFGVLAFLALALFALAVAAGRARERLPAEGALPALVGLLHLVLRVGALVAAGFLVVYLVPTELLPIVTFVLIAAGAAVGWSTRDVLKDYVAGLVLLFEHRLPKGAWVSFQSYAGVVEKVGLRATFLRDGMGHRVSVPNRELLAAPLLLDATGVTEKEVTLRIESSVDAAEIREALRDAVLASPWVAAGITPIVLRDPKDPSVWRVRSRLLHAQFMVSFEGQLLERAEEMLAEKRRARQTTDDVPD